MHENDLEVVKLLHQKCNAAEDRMAQLKSDLESCKSEIDSIEEKYGARESYADILRQAAEALERQDLMVEMPDSDQLKSKFEELTRDFEAADTDAKKYRGLLDQLTEKAPTLLEAAGVSQAPLAVVEAEAPVESEEPTGEEAEAEAKPEKPVEESAQKFNVKTIKRREKSGHGPGAVYIIDGMSVLSRIPTYDYNMRSVDEQQVYEELAKDLCDLGEHISGSFCILANSPLNLEGKVSSAISIVSPGTNGEGEPEDRLHYMLRLADEYTGRLRNVCVVSGEPEVLAEVQNRGLHTMGLSEFFSA